MYITIALSFGGPTQGIYALFASDGSEDLISHSPKSIREGTFNWEIVKSRWLHYDAKPAMDMRNAMRHGMNRRLGVRLSRPVVA